jgi:hypothetical protein
MHAQKLLRVTATIAALALVAVVHTSSTAVAAQGEAVLAGLANGAQATTWIVRSIAICDPAESTGLAVCSPRGVHGLGTDFGVIGTTTTVTGVYGKNTGTSGIGVFGETSGTGSAVYGLTKANGVGVFADAPSSTGTALRGRSENGTALVVEGKAKFSRSGRVTISAGQTSKINGLFPIDPATIVVATVQGNVAGIWVRGVSLDAVADKFTIRLNKAAPAGGVVVGFFIVN